MGADILSLHPDWEISGIWGAKRWVLHPGGTDGRALCYRWRIVGSTVLLLDDLVGRIVSSEVLCLVIRYGLDQFRRS